MFPTSRAPRRRRTPPGAFLALVVSLALLPLSAPGGWAGRAAAAGSGPAAGGYRLVASDGGIFSFGDAPFFGSTGAIRLNRPIVGMAATPSGAGYWLVASDGGMFSFGDAGFFGSAAGRAGDSVVGMAATPAGRGYRVATSSGRVFAFGDAPDLGSAGPVGVPIAGLAPAPGGTGYWLVAADGGVFAFGDAEFMGSTGGTALNRPIVGLAGAPARAEGTSPGGGSSGGSSGATAPAQSSPPTTAPPSNPGGEPQPALSEGPEEPVAPKDAPSGGTSTADVPSSGTRCGLPGPPEKTTQANNTPFISETSGMVASQRYPGLYWTVRDFGHTAAVNAVRIAADGTATAKEFVVDGASNGDWEEVNTSIGPDGRGRLWVVESGQAQLGRIIEIIEPDPAGPRTATLANTYQYGFPDGSFITEASFIHAGRLVLVTKTTPHARMYRFSGLVPGTTNVGSYVGELGNSKDVSLVRQSPDGRLLVTASHEVVHLYRSTDGSGKLDSFNGRLPDCELKAFPQGSVEAGEFSAGRTMEFLSEDKTVYRLPLEDRP